MTSGALLVLASVTHGLWLWEGAARIPDGQVERFGIRPNSPWTELVASWNAELSPGAALQVEAVLPDGRRFVLGVWAEPDHPLRGSVNGQKVGGDAVLSDTLVLSGPANDVELWFGAVGGEVRLDLAAASFVDTRTPPAPREALAEAWGATLDVPLRAQMSYPNGGVLCSPTSVSMVLAYWAAVLGRAELDRDVPMVERAVYDPGLPGCGNWPFNTAFAGSLPGLRGLVFRAPDLRTVEELVVQGLPVVTSVAYDYLLGKSERSGEDGHLVVVVGFTDSGDPVFNDPGRSAVRLVYPRGDFLRAWKESEHTCYLIWPAWPRRLPFALVSPGARE